MSEKFRKEIKSLNDVYSGIVDAIENSPDTSAYEEMRIYFENVLSHMNKWAMEINKVKNSLEEPVKDLTADNRPA